MQIKSINLQNNFLKTDDVEILPFGLRSCNWR